MSYIGNQPPDIGAYDVESFDGGGTSFTLKRSATVSSVLLFIDGVRQTPTDAYTVSGVTLTTTGTTPAGTDNVTVMFMGDVVDIGAPSADTVSTAKIQDDAVTAAKLANSINTEITANTAKVTNATHTGDVTGATALTIAVDAVDIAMLSATGTASATTFLRGDNAWAEAAGGKVLQVTSASSTSDESTTSTSLTATSHTISITPTAASNKIIVTLGGGALGQDVGAKHTVLNIHRSAPSIATFGSGNNREYAASSSITASCALTIIDTAASTAVHTYVVMISTASGGTVRLNQNNDTSYMFAWEIDV